jgi:hypothetical protein
VAAIVYLLRSEVGEAVADVRVTLASPERAALSLSGLKPLNVALISSHWNLPRAKIKHNRRHLLNTRIKNTRGKRTNSVAYYRPALVLAMKPAVLPRCHALFFSPHLVLYSLDQSLQTAELSPLLSGQSHDRKIHKKEISPYRCKVHLEIKENSPTLHTTTSDYVR